MLFYFCCVSILRYLHLFWPYFRIFYNFAGPSKGNSCSSFCIFQRLIIKLRVVLNVVDLIGGPHLPISCVTFLFTIGIIENQDLDQMNTRRFQEKLQRRLFKWKLLFDAIISSDKGSFTYYVITILLILVPHLKHPSLSAQYVNTTY